jgi:hypothetical protein
MIFGDHVAIRKYTRPLACQGICGVGTDVPADFSEAEILKAHPKRKITMVQVKLSL